jgi:acyl-coenzyme A thioesterase PaaI-like protein
LLVEAAAEAMCPGGAVVDVQIHFLAQLKGEIVRTSCTIVRDGPAYRVIRVELLDEPGTVLAIATTCVLMFSNSDSN